MLKGPLALAAAICFLLLMGGGVWWLCSLPNAMPPTTETGAELRGDRPTDRRYQPFEFSEPSSQKSSAFFVDWPPRAPHRTKPDSPALLDGKLFVASGTRADQTLLHLKIELARRETEADRERWNQKLAFPEYDWMSKVRVWDKDDQWLWPNLPFLLRAHGRERVERYGGVDPGKGVDNDFAAIVVRSLDEDGAQQDARGYIALDDAAITAEWHPPKEQDADKHSLIHRAISDDILWPIVTQPGKKEKEGRLGVWLIYADFLGSPPPAGWPREPEFAGGILAYFTVTWKSADGKAEITSVENLVPPSFTGVNWYQWQASFKE
ncbi:MAG: hypothetical protein AAF483_21135 [Planctomycetota bacterium]